MKTPLGLWALGVLVHGAWAMTVAGPTDWDPAYYSEVAANLAAGEGAVTRSAWLHGWLPSSLPQPADLHWMPLPSRVLVPEALLGGWGQVTTVLLGACWAPLAWALARALGASGTVAVLAGVLGASGLGYARFLSTPDSIALYGVVGSLGWLALARSSRALPIWAALAALTRGDGFLLGLAWSGPRRWLAGVAGVGAFAAWQLRGLAVGGERFLALRSSAAAAVTPEAAACGSVAELGARLAAAGSELAGAPVVPLLAGAGLVPVLAAVGAWVKRDHEVVRRALAYAFLFPPIVLVLAPGVGGSGTVFRSLAALAPLGCALAAVGVGAWISARELHRAMFGVLGGAVVLGSVAMGVLYARSAPERDGTCPEVEGPVFASDPFYLASVCRQEAVLLVDCLSADQVEAAVELGVREAWFPEGRENEVGLSIDAAGDVLSGWERVDGSRMRLRD